MSPPIFKTSCAGAGGLIAAEVTPHKAKHWLAQPDSVWHCVIVRHFAMSMSQGQSADPSPVICECEGIAHDLAIAAPAVGAKANASESKRARMVRCKAI